MPEMPEMPEQLGYSITGFCVASGIGRSVTYQLIAAGKLDARKVGDKTIITAESARALMASLPRAAIGIGKRKGATPTPTAPAAA